MGISVRLEGVAAVTGALQAIGKELGDLRGVNSALAVRAARAAASAAPRRTGRLARSIRGRGGPRRAVVVASAQYSRYQNYGWGDHLGKQFMRRADAVFRQRAEHDIDQAIDRIIEREHLR